ncbi:MAG: Gfo/Idh/MocA family oxidoreductase [Acidimicrobiales bacterium]
MPTTPSSARPLRYGVIGTGMMGCEHLLNLGRIDAAEVVAISDPHQPSRELGLACALDGRPDAHVDVYEHHRDLLARDDLDAVVIASPNHTHVDVLADALATDLHVMVEKPLCTTVEDAQRAREMATGRTRNGAPAMCWVALEYRYMPTPATLLDMVRAGAVGRAHMVSIREHRFPFLTKVGDWNRFSANTGGTLVEKCCHFFDLMHQLAGARPVRVIASGGQDVNHLDELVELPDGTTARPDILDNAYVIVEFANGVRGALDLCMFAEGGRHEQELCVVGDRAKLETTVPGDVVWNGARPAFGAAPDGPVGVSAPMDAEVRYEGFHHGSSYREHLRFIEQANSGGDALVTVDDGLWSVAMGAAAHRSIDERRPVDLAEWGLS